MKQYFICLNCDCEEYIESEDFITQYYKGLTLTVKTPVVKCAKCDWTTIGNGQLDALLKNANAEYEKRLNLEK